MKDYHVIGVVDNTLPSTIELPDDVDIGTFGASSIVPRFSQVDDVQHAGLFILDGEHLPLIRRWGAHERRISYFFRSFAARLVLI